MADNICNSTDVGLLVYLSESVSVITDALMRAPVHVWVCMQDHNIARQCVHCCKGNAASQWERAFFGCQNSVTPQLIDSKFKTRDNVVELTSCAKFHKIWKHRGLPAIWWNLHLVTDEHQIITLSTQLPIVSDAVYIIYTHCTVV